jgi:hypothetical protein
MSANLDVTERSDAATEERLKSGHAVGGEQRSGGQPKVTDECVHVETRVVFVRRDSVGSEDLQRVEAHGPCARKHTGGNCRKSHDRHGDGRRPQDLAGGYVIDGA